MLLQQLAYLIFSFTVLMTRRSQTNPNEAKCSKKANRPSTYKKRPPGLDTYTCNMALNIVARKVDIMNANNGGVALHGAVSAIVSKMKPTLPWFNVKMLRSHLKKLNKQKSKQPAEMWNNISCCRACRCRHHQQRWFVAFYLDCWHHISSRQQFKWWQQQYYYSYS